jgi:hypothetical protein
MKILPAAALLLLNSVFSLCTLAQDTVMQDDPIRDTVMQDTVIISDPHFKIVGLHMPATEMQDTLIEKVRTFVVRAIPLPDYEMQDTVFARDLSFVVRDLYAERDSLNAIRDSLAIIRDSLKVISDSIYLDSVNRHWIGWNKYQVNSGYSYTLFSKKVLKGKSKSELQYNIADFYLYLNGQLVKPPKTGYSFFAAGCICFKYDDTLLLNSGLGFKVGVGVGIKIIQGRFTSTLHANMHNNEIYRLSKEDSFYMKNVMVAPVTQSLKLRNEPAYASNEVITGEYQASYKKFFQKNDRDQDEVRRYTVRIIFRCRVTGGVDSIKSLSGMNSK